jgi:hypothetical protein
MNRRRELLVILCAVVVITTAVSHALMLWLRIETTFGEHWQICRQQSGPPAFLAGSSLAGDGIMWTAICGPIQRPIQGWGVAGSSPSEWERFQDLANTSDRTLIVVSPYDLNEEFLSDFRADIVPLQRTASDLWNSRADWAFSKRVLSAYPLHYLRWVYPTAGRSQGVIAGVREELSKAGSRVEATGKAGPTLSFDATDLQSYKNETIADWSPARMLRRLTELRSGSQGRHVFSGPKKLAFERMLQRAQTRGPVIVVVLPVSPPYIQQFLTPAGESRFEAALRSAAQSAPAVRWIRLDRHSELHTTDNYWDLVHMNVRGQRLATRALIAELRNAQ